MDTLQPLKTGCRQRLSNPLAAKTGRGFGHVSARLPDTDLFLMTPRIRSRSSGGNRPSHLESAR